MYQTVDDRVIEVTRIEDQSFQDGHKVAPAT